MTQKQGWLLYAGGVLVVAAIGSFSPFQLFFGASEGVEHSVGAMFQYDEEPLAPFSEEGGKEVVIIEQVQAGDSVSYKEGKVYVSGPRKLTNVVKHIKLNLVSFRYWYLQSDFELVDTVTVSFSILSNGMVEGVALTSSRELDREFKLQLINQIEQFEFYQKGVAEKTVVRYPIYFLEGKKLF